MSDDAPREPSSAPTPSRDVMDAVAGATAKVAADLTAEAARARRQPPSEAWRSLVAGGLAVVAIALWVFFPPRVDDRDPRPPERIERDLRLEIVSLAGHIEGYRAARGALPDSLAATGTTSENVRYTRIDATVYELSGTERGRAITYRSTQPLAELTAGLSVRAVVP
jgi:hypothetical protein